MPKSHGHRPLTESRCGKCHDRLTEDELEENREQGRYGEQLRCIHCIAQALGGNDPSTADPEMAAMEARDCNEKEGNE